MWKYGKPISRCGGFFPTGGKGSAPTYRHWQVYMYPLTKIHSDSACLTNYLFTKCYAKAAYPSPTDESGFDTPPSSSAATSS